MMTRLLVHVEGETEETFVNEVLRTHLVEAGYHSVGARLVGNSRARARRGGIASWDVVKRDIVRHLSGDPGCTATTMVDFYALPTSWPGRTQAVGLASFKKTECMNSALLNDMEASTPHWQRFEPFVLMHEFEALLFSDCAAFTAAIGHNAAAHPLQQIRDAFATPEDINDSPETAPSKRVGAVIKGYQKVLSGSVGAIGIGLDNIRQQCPSFHNWLSRLEARITQS